MLNIIFWFGKKVRYEKSCVCKLFFEIWSWFLCFSKFRENDGSSKTCYKCSKAIAPILHVSNLNIYHKYYISRESFILQLLFFCSQYQQVFLEKLKSMSRFQYKSNTILYLNFTCYFSKFRIWLWAFFMWTLNECLVLEVLLQMWQISSGRITCFASMCLVTSILLDFVWPQMLQTHWFSTLEQLASTKKGSWSCVISTLPGTSRSIIIQNWIILCLLLFGECLSQDVCFSCEYEENA